MTIEIYRGRELPGWSLFCIDAAGQPIDYSTGYTFAVTVRVGGDDTPIPATVTANADPTDDTGSPDDVPSVHVLPDAGALDALEAGAAVVILVATTGGRDREARFPAKVLT